jgi:hypothetical protein
VEYGRLTLILDDEAGRIGQLALRLVGLGVNVHYANDFDEAVLLAQQGADDVGAVIVPSDRAAEWLPTILKRLRLPPTAVVAAGERPDDDAVESLRAQGVRWALWTLDDDRDARFVVTAAMSETDADEVRSNLRMPTELEGGVQRGPLDRPCVIRDLSAAGALVALDPPVSPGSRVTLRIAVGESSLTLRARVAWSSEYAEAPALAPGPAMGVRFEDVDAEARDVLVRFLAKQLERFLL